AGVSIQGSGTSGNVVAGNYIGTDPSGAPGLGNKFGVAVGTGAGANTIGGTSAEARNVISSNSIHQVALNGPGGSNLVAGNYVGTSAAGTAAAETASGISIAHFGIVISPAAGNR